MFAQFSGFFRQFSCFCGVLIPLAPKRNRLMIQMGCVKSRSKAIATAWNMYFAMPIPLGGAVKARF
ncbi:hypothetical protein BIZ35_11510 [Heyndrickxia coagulans]|jgi:hypothetical protein|uniref:Uncharacterized protein n=1 Tax=Heyndrickxia coagulans TaxID=1398 RepID=A0A150JZX2_HEYCO|nr:hypothetical protein BIZ35_11510 [Heyndrickxia coagulans]KYC62859.1 hypothetical protein B4099_1893 [Heyndrickxia coagulans]KYC74494.1 hypothetical protein B4096_1833 [Heyndrickxia coagulans]RGR81358.1 hypothetical protein DWY22_13230 [Heyndrickxia coagulans]RGR94901.1 hypothetical protein DWY16_13520 [Heyndrickxia coagulans]